jgi:hypothetical protein
LLPIKIKTSTQDHNGRNNRKPLRLGLYGTGEYRLKGPNHPSQRKDSLSQVKLRSFGEAKKYNGANKSAASVNAEQFYILLVECFENWASEIEDNNDTAELQGSMSDLTKSVCKLNLLEPVDLQRKTQYYLFDDLVEKYLQKSAKKSVKKKEATKEEIQLKNNLEIQINTLQQLKGIFLEFIETTQISEQTTNHFHEMLKEMKDLYNTIIGNKMYIDKDDAIDEVSLMLDVCNRYKGKFQSLQEYVKRGGKWETALSKGIEEGLGRSSFGEKPSSVSRKSQNDAMQKEMDLKFSKLKNSELIKYSTGENKKSGVKLNEKGKYNNPFENSSIEELKTPGKKSKSPEVEKKKINHSSSFQHLERNDSTQTMDELKNFIIKEKIELENEIVALKLRLEKKDNQILELKVKNEQQATKISSLSNQNSNLQRQVKEYKEEIYARILNLTMTSNKTGSHSMNRYDSSKKMGFRDKYKNRMDTSTPIKRSTSFLSKPEDRIEKTKKDPENFDMLKASNQNREPTVKLDKKSLANSKAFLQDFNKEIDNILNRTGKAKHDSSSGLRRHDSQKKIYRGTETKRNYMDLANKNNISSYTASKPSLPTNTFDPLGKDYDPLSRIKDLRGTLPKVKSQQYFGNDLTGKDYPELGGGLRYPQRNRMAYTLNLGEQPSYGVPGMGDYDNFGLHKRMDNRPSSFTNHDNMFNPRGTDQGMMNADDPHFQSKFQDMNNFRSSMYTEGRFQRGPDINAHFDMGVNMEAQRDTSGTFDAAKKLEKYKNQMKMKQPADNNYGGRFY